MVAGVQGTPWGLQGSQSIECVAWWTSSIPRDWNPTNTACRTKFSDLTEDFFKNKVPQHTRRSRVHCSYFSLLIVPVVTYSWSTVVTYRYDARKVIPPINIDLATFGVVQDYFPPNMDSAKGLLCEFPWDGKSKGNDASVMTNLEKETPQQSVVLLDEEPKAQDVTGMFFFSPNKNSWFPTFSGAIFLEDWFTTPYSYMWCYIPYLLTLTKHY